MPSTRCRSGRAFRHVRARYCRSLSLLTSSSSMIRSNLPKWRRGQLRLTRLASANGLPAARSKRLLWEPSNTITNPPQNPSHDFLGEMRSNSLCLPSMEPTKNAPVSFNHTNMNIAKMSQGAYCYPDESAKASPGRRTK